MNTIYFLDYSVDEVKPVSCDEDLFVEYQSACEKLEEVCKTFKNKEDLFETAMEYAPYARCGVQGYRAVSRGEMESLISCCLRRLEERKKRAKLAITRYTPTGLTAGEIVDVIREYGTENDTLVPGERIGNQKECSIVITVQFMGG